MIPRRILSLLAAVATLACGRATRVAEPPAPAVSPDAIESSMFLVGDAGDPEENDPVFSTLELQLRSAPARRYLVYLGDNIYPRGLPDTGRGREEAERRLDAQIAIALRTETRTWFIPGNHDWDYMGPDGWNAIRRQAQYIEDHGRPFATVRPLGGCPGPSVEDLDSRLRLVMLDTQWWLHDFEKPRDSTSACRYYEIRDVALALDGALAQAGERHVVVVGHHPIISGGEHGGHMGLSAHLFPLRQLIEWLWVPAPILGSAYAFNRAQGASNQDVKGPENVRMRRALNWVFTRRKPLVYAAGHEHNLQVFDGRTARNVLVSGSAIYGHVTHVHQVSNMRYGAALSGYMRLDVLHDGRVRLSVITVGGDQRPTESFSRFLD